MNRIYKSIFNAARRCVVCVSEIQSSRIKTKSDRKNAPVKPVLSMLSASVLMAVSATSLAVPQPRDVLYPIGGVNYDCSSGTTCVPVDAGGESNWSYTFQGLQNNDTLEMTATDQTLYESLADGGTGSLMIEEGYTAIISGGSTRHIYAFKNLVTNNGNAKIVNEGTLTIQGGIYTDTKGVYYGAAEGSSFITNEGEGNLTIQGGTGEHSYGINYHAYGSSSTGTINNTGSGTLTIQDGNGNAARGIYVNAYNGGQGTISNEGIGELNILGNEAIETNAWGSGSLGIISNIGNGTLTIQGGDGNWEGAIEYNANRSGKASIENNGSGNLVIKGGVGWAVNGISYNAYGSGSNGTIINTGSGTLTIQGGKGNTSHGIKYNAHGGGNGTIKNSANGNLNIFGDTESGTYGIESFTHGSSTSLLENAGVMNLNQYAIKQFVGFGTPESISVVNKSTGTVNAEAGAIFVSDTIESTVVTPLPITIYTPQQGTKTVKLDSYGTSETVVTTGWKLKDDWANYSTWEDGGKLIINDIVAGSDEAKQITEAFQNKFGTGTTIEFTGTEVSSYWISSGDGDSSDGPVFSLEHVNELIDNGEIKNGSVVTSEVLSGKPDGGFTISNLVIGDSYWSGGNEVISQDIGFKGITDFYATTVADGYSLTLVGEQAAMAMALRTTESQATFQLTDRPVTVQADSTLKLGIADLSATQGYFEDLTLAESSAALSVENGIFQITNVMGSGQINVQEKGQLTIANKASAGEVVNNGVLTANAASTQIGGSAAVATMADEDQNHFETFTNEKGGEANFADVTVAEGANVKNKAEATINAGAVVVNGGAAITNFKDGTLNVESLEMNGTLRNNGTINVTGDMTLTEGTSTTLAGKVTAGTFSIGRAAQKAQPASFMLMTEPRTAAEITGETYSKVLDLAGGDVAIRKDAILAGIELKDNIVNSHVTVDVDGTFAFSYNENQLESALKDLKLDTEGKALVVLSTDLSFGENGSLTVGTTDATDTINLGSDALLLLGTDKLHGGAVLDGEGKESLNIKEGAILAFTDDAIWGNHYIVSDFVSMDAAENLTVKDLEGNELKTHHNDKGIYVTIGSNNILDKDVDFGLSNNINAIMDGMQDTTSSKADIRYLSMAMGAKDGVKQTNDLQHLSAQAGILSEAYHLTDNAHESIIRHAMSDKYANVWVEALAGKGGVDGAETGYSDASYDSDSYGMIFGVDGRIGSDINIGAAIHYQKGDLEADSSETKNEFKNYGASIYAGTNFGNLNVTAGITYAKGDHEFNQVNLGYVEGDTDTEIFMGGIRASYPFMLNRILVTPYAGLEAVHVKEDGFTAKIGGAEAFDFGSVSETFGRVPMGVKFSGGNDRFAGFADISVIPQFGNRDAKQSVSGINTKATDAAKFDYADSVLGRVKMGAAYQVTPSTTLSVSYGASMGDVRDLSHEFSLNAKYRF